MTLQYPPHVVAIACIYLAALLSTFEQNETRPPSGGRSNHEIVALLGDHGPWEKKFQAHVDDLEGKSLRHLSVGCPCSTVSLRPLGEPIRHQFSNLSYASRPADNPNTKSLCQHDTQHAIVSVTPHLAGRNAHSSTGIAHLGPAYAA